MVSDDALLTSVAVVNDVDSECGFEVQQQWLWCLQSVLSQLGLPSSPDCEGGRSAMAGRAAARALYIAGNHVTGFFVCWPPPLVNVLTLSALRSGDARALDLSLAASHRA